MASHCGDELVVGFSCKSRSVCPSCCARRAAATAVQLLDAVLPVAPYRQWTLSFPWRLRWALAKDAALTSRVLAVFLRALERRREYTVIGRPVNLASRIEGLTKDLQCPLLVSEETKRQAGDAFHWEPAAPMQVQGVAEPVRTFSPAAG